MIELVDASYRYASGEEVGPLDLVVHPGEKVVLAGPSGAGKTTLLRLCAGLAGGGTTSGTVRIDGVDPVRLAKATRPERIAFVSQEPGDQLVCGTVADEIAFGPECAGFPPPCSDACVAHGLSELGLTVGGGRSPRTLSTGEQQRLVVAAALAAGARNLVLDEPLAHLDPHGAKLLLDALDRAAARGVAVLMTEHRLHWVLPWASRVIWLSAPEPALERHWARRALGETLLSAQAISHRYGNHIVLDDVSLALRAGERVALLGANGAGKSTLLGHLSGELTSPNAHLSGQPCAIVPADPDLSLFRSTVADEVSFGPADRGLPGALVRQMVQRVSAAFDLGALLSRSPHALSRGQRLRVAVAAVVIDEPTVLLLDEPTAGQDSSAVETMLSAVDTLLPHSAVLFATHDHDLASRFASRTLVLHAGHLSER